LLLFFIAQSVNKIRLDKIRPVAGAKPLAPFLERKYMEDVFVSMKKRPKMRG
jgi:hypothetical protein